MNTCATGSIMVKWPLRKESFVMADAILISCQNENLPVGVRQLLADAGYNLRWSDDPVIAYSALKGPESLVLIETALQREKQEQCAELNEEARHRHVPCLIFSATGENFDTKLLEHPRGIIRDPESLTEWAEKIALYRQLSWQAKELQQMQGRLLARSEEEEEDLRSAAMIQKSLLPSKIPDIGGMKFAWEFSPFEKIGGDLFNVLQVDEENMMAFLLDVSGHGISSAMVTVSVNQSLSTHTSQVVKKVFAEPPYYRLLSPAEVMCELANEYPFDRFDKFFTVIYMLINIKTGKLSYSCAGHPAPLLLRADGSIEWLTVGGGLIGLLDTGPYEEAQLTLSPGDRLFLYSDGLTEYSNYSGDLFGAERLVDVLSRDGRSLKENCGSVLKALDHFGNNRPLQDDVSLLGMEFLGPDKD